MLSWLLAALLLDLVVPKCTPSPAEHVLCTVNADMLGTLTSDILSGGGDSRSAGAISLVRQLVDGKGTDLARSPRPQLALMYSSMIDSCNMTRTSVSVIAVMSRVMLKHVHK